MLSGFLRQSTATQARATPIFVDQTDGFTPETGLTIANTDVKLSKNGAATVNKNSGGGTHIANGSYSLTFDATDSNTVGELSVTIVISGTARPVNFCYVVLEEVVYDLLFAAGSPVARAEPGQGAPAASADSLTKIDYLFKAWRNKKTQTATEFKLYADDGVTVDQKAPVSDDGTTGSFGEKLTGP